MILSNLLGCKNQDVNNDIELSNLLEAYGINKNIEFAANLSDTMKKFPKLRDIIIYEPLTYKMYFNSYLVKQILDVDIPPNTKATTFSLNVLTHFCDLT